MENVFVALSSGLIGTIIGALISGIITYLYNRKQLKNNLQIRACEEILMKIDELNLALLEAYSKLFFLIPNIKNYNQNLGEQNNLYKVYLNSVMNDIKEHQEKWNNYILAYNNYSNTYESKEVILHDFKPIYNYIAKELNLLFQTQNRLIVHYNNKISLQLMSSKLISADGIDEIINIYDKFTSLYCDIQGYFNDFKHELQNYVYSDLFDKYKIQKRKPIDKNVVVLSLDKKNIQQRT